MLFRRLGKVRKLAAMPPAEIASRLRQAWAKQVDARGLRSPTFRHQLPTGAAREPHFFFDPADLPHRLELIRAMVPDFESCVLAQADGILRNRIPLLGYGMTDLGPQIDWQLDIISGKRAPSIPWPRIRYLDFNEVGDSKVTWEISRHQFLVTLAKAWILSGDDRYFARLEEFFDDWQKGNPYPTGTNWTSSLEVAFRSLSWVWVRELVRGNVRSKKLVDRIADALGFNAWFIERYLSTYFSPNTHLQGEAVALFFIGTLCPGFAQAERWRDLGWGVLLEHAGQKVLTDGAYFEQSTYYHVYALDFFLHARTLAQRNGMHIPPAFDDVIRRMLNYLAALCQAGSPPRMGDDDGGRVFDGTRNRAAHLSDPLALGCGLYANENWKPPGAAVTEEMLWLLGESGLAHWQSCSNREPGQSAVFSQTGVFILNDTGRAGSQAIIDVGPLGGGSGGHGHADTLSVTLNLDGRQAIVDPGACVYVGPGPERTDFRTTKAHNTIVVDGRSQAEPGTAFSWGRWPVARQEAVVSTREFDWVVGSHDGYGQGRRPVTHRRSVLRTPDGFWAVVDRLETQGTHAYELYWHLEPDAEVGALSSTSWLVKLGNPAGPSSPDIVTGNAAPRQLLIRSHTQGWTGAICTGGYSVAYGQHQHAPVVRLAKHDGADETLLTLLWPFDPHGPLPDIALIASNGGGSTWTLRSGGESWLLCLGNGDQALDADGWHSDATMLCVKRGMDDSIAYVAAAGCSYIRCDGLVILPPGERKVSFYWTA